ncbi:threonine synthase [Blastococcus sp. CT_GayMR20]|uniref:threonine synthase n=1 Tax=Blastococcus sp. CT_GayMR20 TaxID=2559609 RepID=UPI0010739BDE|nr:threonine synthase [Blastococcus sp. CT_GayMR20]TFV81171.1 threonine synthase [Blastococcus sp. CT_GayMR20]
MTTTRCTSCGGTLAAAVEPRLPLVTPGGEGVWRYASQLPAVGEGSRVSIGEGGTPLLRAPRLSAELGVDVRIKDETRNPTGSFKDRIIAVAAGVAVEAQAAGLVCASTGNAGASTAAYAARSGLPGLVIAPVGAPFAKVTIAQVYGARWISVEGDYSDAYSLAVAAAADLGFMNVTTTFVCPYSVAGSTTVGFELFEDLDGQVPDWIVVPIGAGPLLVGLEAAYAALRRLGLVDRVPRLLAVQPTGCAPIVRAYRDGDANVRGWGRPDTLVSGLADPLNGYEEEGDITLAAIRRSGGAGVVVDDDSTLAWVHRLASRAGVFAEPSGAIAVAAVEQARRDGVVSQGETVVCCVTGSGLKDLKSAGTPTSPPVIRSSVEELSELLARD